jgi:DNA-binding XRE family transcriptional regulator
MGGQKMKQATITSAEIGRIRRRAGMSKAEMAVKLGVSEATIYAYEKGTRIMPEIRERLILAVDNSMHGTRTS